MSLVHAVGNGVFPCRSWGGQEKRSGCGLGPDLEPESVQHCLDIVASGLATAIEKFIDGRARQLWAQGAGSFPELITSEALSLHFFDDRPTDAAHKMAASHPRAIGRLLFGDVARVDW